MNLLLTECSGNLIDQLTASRVSTINFVLCDRDLLGSASNADFSTVCVLYDTALKNAGFVLDNEGTWMNDGVVTLVRPVPEPASAALGLLGLGVLCCAAAGIERPPGSCSPCFPSDSGPGERRIKIREPRRETRFPEEK